MATKKQTKTKPEKKVSKHTQNNIKLAEDPKTSSEQLEKLSLSTNEAVKRRVAANPNTPGPVLLRLSKYYFNSFAENPALPLLLLDNPTILQGIPLHAANRLADLKNLPEHVIRALASSPNAEIRARIATHPDMPREGFEELLFDDDFTVRQNTQKNINVPEDLIALHRQCELRSGDISEEQLRWLAARGIGGKELAAKHPQTPPDLLETLYEQGEAYYKKNNGVLQSLGDNLCISIVRNPNTPIHILQRALEHKTPYIRAEAIQNKNLPTAMIEPHVKTLSPYWSIRLLDRRDISAEALSAIVDDKKNDYFHIEKIFYHPSFTEEHLAKLATSSDYRIRLQVANHPNTPIDALHMLVNDPNTHVKSTAQTNLVAKNTAGKI